MKVKLDFRLIYFDRFRLLKIILILHLLHYSSAIQLRQLYIPEQIELGKSVYLICDFKLERGETLYSVKFYKNNLEFYRYLNRSAETPSPNQYTNWYDHKDFTIFPQSGIYLDKRKSNTSHVLLKKSDYNTEGTYECEVSTSTFSTVIAAKDLKIFVQPKNPLLFSVVQHEKQVNAICQTYASKPPSMIYFLLNGQLIKQPLYKYLQLGDLITSRSSGSDPLVSSTLSLKIPVASLTAISELVNSAEYRQFKIDPTKYDASLAESAFASYSGGAYPAGSYSAGSYSAGSYSAGSYSANSYSANSYPAASYSPSSYSASAYSTSGRGAPTTKADQTNEFAQLANQRSEQQIGDESVTTRFKHYRFRRNDRKQLNSNRLNAPGNQPVAGRLNKHDELNNPNKPLNANNRPERGEHTAFDGPGIQQTRHRRTVANNADNIDNGARDQSPSSANGLQSGLRNRSLSSLSTNKGTADRTKAGSEASANRTINQVNGLISLIQKSLNDSNLMPLKNSVNSGISASDPVSDKASNFGDRASTVLALSSESGHLAGSRLEYADQRWPISGKSFFYQTNHPDAKTSRNADRRPDEPAVDRPAASISSLPLRVSSSSIDPLDSHHYAPDAPASQFAISHRYLPKPERLIFDSDDKNNEADTERAGLELSCVSTIAQPLATTYDEMSLEENSYLERKTETADQQNDQPVYVADEFSVPRIIANEETLISTGNSFRANCTVSLFQHWSLNRLQPILKWFINDREAHLDELIPYNNQELYDKNVRNFSQSYAYALLPGHLLRQLRGNSSNASLKNQQQPYLNDQNNKFNLRLLNKRRRRSTMTLGLRIVLSKEHFQADGSIKLRCTCTYSTLLKHEMQSVQLQSSGRRTALWFASSSRRSFVK